MASSNGNGNGSSDENCNNNEDYGKHDDGDQAEPRKKITPATTGTSSVAGTASTSAAELSSSSSLLLDGDDRSKENSIHKLEFIGEEDDDIAAPPCQSHKLLRRSTTKIKQQR